MLINILGIFLIVFIILWFWILKPRKIFATKSLEILVDNGVYSPAIIKAKPGKLELVFLRKDPSPCAQWVIFPELKISSELALERRKRLVLQLEKPGSYNFNCQMGMYRGKLIVE